MVTKEKLQRLKEFGCDTDGALTRVLGKEEIYLHCITEFLEEKDMDDAETAVRMGDMMETREKIHGMKGVCGNLGFTEVYKITCTMMDLFKSGRDREAVEMFPQLRMEYDRLTSMIRSIISD